MARECCHNCLYAYWDRRDLMASFVTGFAHRPACANHPDSLGRMRPVPAGRLCRNYRRRPADPAQGAKQIPLGDGVYAYVDAADYEWLSQYNWRLQNGYAARREKTKVIYMHREIMKPPKGMKVDHRHRNRLDNTRDSLRICTQQENSHNSGKHMGASSRFKGVGYSRDRRKWFAKAYIDGERIWLGYHLEEETAARAYDAKAVELFGEFAHLNFPDEWPPVRRNEVHAKWLEERAKEKGKRKKSKTKSKKTSGQKPSARPKTRKRGKSKRPTPAAKRRTKSTRVTGHEPRTTAPKKPRAKTRGRKEQNRATRKGKGRTGPAR